MVSIIIPYIDEKDFLAEALKSASEQLYHAEIILVCNQRILSTGYPFPENKSNILFLHEPIPGSAYARNEGLQHASGDWIQFLDVDDLLMPDKISHQLEHTSTPGDRSVQVPTGDVIVSPHFYRHLDGATEVSKWLPDDIWRGILNSGLGSTSSMLWKKQVLLDVGGWSSAYQSHQEYELLFRIAAAGYQIVCDDRAETIVRQRKSGSITIGSHSVRAEEGIRLREAIWKHLTENEMDTPERKNAFLQYIFRQLRGLYRKDQVKAREIFKRYFTFEEFSPEQIGIPLYSLIYKMFGFQATENLFKSYSAIRDKYLPFLPKNN